MPDHIEKDKIFLSPSKEFLGSSLLRNSFFLPLDIHFSLNEKSIERIKLACNSHKLCREVEQTAISGEPNVQSHPEVCEKYGLAPFNITFTGKNLPLQRDILTWMEEYLKGTQPPFSLPMHKDALSPFCFRVHQKVAEIPFGETFTYGDIARQIGSPSACRAVGNALNKNPFPLLIPCHRVIGKNDSGGFAYGIAIKKLLLTFENRDCCELKLLE